MSRSLGLSILVVMGAVASCGAILGMSRGVPVASGSVHFSPEEYRFDVPLPAGPRRGETTDPVKFDVPVAVRNDTRRDVTLLGGPSFCGSRGCLYLDGFPLMIPPGGDGRISIRFSPGMPGPFDHRAVLYTDAPGQAEIVLRITGTVLPFVEKTTRVPQAGAPSEEMSR